MKYPMNERDSHSRVGQDAVEREGTSVARRAPLFSQEFYVVVVTLLIAVGLCSLAVKQIVYGPTGGQSRRPLPLLITEGGTSNSPKRLVKMVLPDLRPEEAFGTLQQLGFRRVRALMLSAKPLVSRPKGQPFDLINWIYESEEAGFKRRVELYGFPERRVHFMIASVVPGGGTEADTLEFFQSLTTVSFRGSNAGQAKEWMADNVRVAKAEVVIGPATYRFFRDRFNLSKLVIAGLEETASTPGDQRP